MNNLTAGVSRRVVKAVIFDIDGTMLDSVDLHAKAWHEAFARFGREVPYDKIRSQIGKGGDQLMPVFLSQPELEEFGKELEHYRGTLFKDTFLPQVRPFPRVRALFSRLAHDQKQVAVASSAKGDELAHYLKLAEVEDLLSAKVSSDEVERSKPHPDIFEAALGQLNGTSSESALVVGDTPYDIEAANKAGMRTVAVTCGGFAEEDLRHAGAIAIYRDLADILENYENSPFCAR
jgi:phosphoglycolate phosphatase-like HAD superfamily hydrolase